MPQKSKSQREKRRRKWFDQELPVLLVRLRLVAPPDYVDTWKNCKLKTAPVLRAIVSYWEHDSSTNPAERS